MTAPVGALLVAALLFFGAGCSNVEPPSPGRPAPSAEEQPRARRGPPQRLGRIRHDALVEVSGIAASRTYPGVLWAHNDSGDGPHLYCLRTDGTDCGVYEIEGARAIDWEDIALGRSSEGPDQIYIGDIGDNQGTRTSVTVYVVDEPEPDGGGGIPAIGYSLSYPGKARDAETLMVSAHGDLFIVTKSFGRADVFAASAPLKHRMRLRRVARIDLDGGIDAVTAGDLAPDGTRALLATYGGVFELTAPQGSERWWTGESRRVRVGRFRQLEAVAYSPDATLAYATSEGRHPPLRAAELAG